jgi:hypothetical protein
VVNGVAGDRRASLIGASASTGVLAVVTLPHCLDQF